MAEAEDFKILYIGWPVKLFLKWAWSWLCDLWVLGNKW